VRLIAQNEADRRDPQNPSKVRWSTLQWFQILLYIKSEHYEGQQEINSVLDDEDMIIRYLKHLLLITSRRNSFHISLGLSRLLYNYTAAETMAIYDWVFQDPDSSTKKADAYFRARKNKLIEEMEKRFHGFLTIYQGPRGEKKFASKSDSYQFNDLVVHYLNRFTPWATGCELPKHLDTSAPIRSLRSNQTSQIHSLIHPACFSRITQALRIDPPEKRLTIPVFLRSGKGPDSAEGPEDSSSTNLTEDETATIRNRIADEAKGRKRFEARSLIVMADGSERARLNLLQSNQIPFVTREDETLIELIGKSAEEEILLATYVLNPELEGSEANTSSEYSIALEGGQTISLVVSPYLPDKNGSLQFLVELTYRTTTARNKSKSFVRAVDIGSLWNWTKTRVLTPLTISALIVLTAAAILLFLVSRRKVSGPEHLAQKEPLVESTSSGSPLITSPNPKPEPVRESIRSPRRDPGSNRSSSGVTREASDSAVKSLLNIGPIYVEIEGDDGFSREIQQELNENLQRGNNFVIGRSKDEANAAIMGRPRLEYKPRPGTADQGKDTGSVRLELVNISGEVIWRPRAYRGTADQIASKFVKDLLSAVESERRRKKR
jgi:hypothetical protein